MEDNLIIIEVRGGVAEVTLKPNNARVIIFDWDNVSEARAASEEESEEYVPQDYPAGDDQNGIGSLIFEKSDALGQYLRAQHLLR